MDFHRIPDIKAIKYAGSVLHGLKLNEIGYGTAINIFVGFNYKFSCFERSASLNCFEFCNDFACKIESHGYLLFVRSYYLIGGLKIVF